MSTAASLRNTAIKPQLLSNSPQTGLLLYRKCTCGSPKSALTGDCEECKGKKRLQAKLSIGASNDPMEREADRVADQVLAAAVHSAVSTATPNIQRFSRQLAGDEGTALPSVDSVLASSGRPLDKPLQQDMEQRFGHDFSRVRVHTGGAAEQSARDVSAHAYTVGHNVVFGAGQFAPEAHEGRRLLAHELTHVVQQSDTGTYAVQDNKKNGLSPIRPAHLARWAIKGATAEVDSEKDRLGQLPGQVKSSALNWVCIRPVFMRTTSNPTPPADFDAHYEKYLNLGDTFDISNLKTTYKGTSLKLSLFDKTENNHIVLSTLYPGVNTSKDPDQDIKATAQEGKTPIADFLIGGHQAGGEMYGSSGRFEPGKLSADEPAPAFSRAKDSKFPRRCWFTHYGTARSVGCSSDSFGKSFASLYLSKEAGIDTTMRMIAPTCTSKFMRPDGSCESIDAIEFRQASGEEKTADHGPFKLSEPNKFHGSPFWNRIAGAL